jgi:hypothetical protein
MKDSDIRTSALRVIDDAQSALALLTYQTWSSVSLMSQFIAF